MQGWTAVHIVAVDASPAVTVCMLTETAFHIVAKVLCCTRCISSLTQLIDTVIPVGYRIAVSIRSCCHISGMVIVILLFYAVRKRQLCHSSPQVCRVGCLIAITIYKSRDISQSIIAVCLCSARICRQQASSSCKVIAKLHTADAVTLMLCLTILVVAKLTDMASLRGINICISAKKIIDIAVALCLRAVLRILLRINAAYQVTVAVIAADASCSIAIRHFAKTVHSVIVVNSSVILAVCHLSQISHLIIAVGSTVTDGSVLLLMKLCCHSVTQVILTQDFIACRSLNANDITTLVIGIARGNISSSTALLVCTLCHTYDAPCRRVFIVTLMPDILCNLLLLHRALIALIVRILHMRAC